MRPFTWDCLAEQKIKKSVFLLSLLNIFPDCFVDYLLPRPSPCNLSSNIPISHKHIHTCVSFLLPGILLLAFLTWPTSTHLSKCSSGITSLATISLSHLHSLIRRDSWVLWPDNCTFQCFHMLCAKNCQGCEFLPTLKLTSLPVTVSCWQKTRESWMRDDGLY